MLSKHTLNHTHSHTHRSVKQVPVEVRTVSGNTLSDAKGIISVIQNWNISATALGVTLSHISAAAFLKSCPD